MRDGNEVPRDDVASMFDDIAPVYDRLKFLPVVRVEVGRGSNYVYTIEYLAN